jgi:hypothetical protein
MSPVMIPMKRKPSRTRADEGFESPPPQLFHPTFGVEGEVKDT